MKRVSLTMWCPVLPARAVPLLSLMRATRREVVECLDHCAPEWRRSTVRIAKIRLSETPTRFSK